MTIKEREKFKEKLIQLFKLVKDERDRRIEIIDEDNYLHRLEFAKSLYSTDYWLYHLVLDPRKDYCFEELWYFNENTFEVVEKRDAMSEINQDKILMKCNIDMNELFKKMDLMIVKLI